MNTVASIHRRLAVFASFVLSGALSLSAFAVNLEPNTSHDVGAPQTVDTVNYRSNAGRHKVMIERDNADRAKHARVKRTLNYVAFQVLEVDRATADSLIASGIASNADVQNLILLNSGAVDTTAPAVVANNSKALAIGSGKQLHLVQFPGPIQAEWYAKLEATGVQIVNAIPSNAYLVYGDAIALENVAALANTGLAQWQGPYLASYKLQPGVPTSSTLNIANSAKSLVQQTLADPKGNVYTVQLFQDPSTNAVTEALLSTLSVVSRYEIKSYVNLVVTLTPELLDQISKRPDVISVAKYAEPKRMDERQAITLAGDLIGNAPNPGNYFTKLSTWGLTQAQFTASGLVVDVTDDGVDRNPTGADPGTIGTDSNAGPVPARHFVLYEGGATTNPSRFVYKGRWGSGSITDGGLGKSGHGQLNMSIIGGYVPDSFDTSNSRVHRDAQGFRFGLGIAPFVKLGNSVIFDPTFTNPNYGNLLSTAYAGGARVSSNSWGSDSAGAYTADAQAYDILVRDSQSGTAGSQQMLVVFSAGNSGPGLQTIGAPGSGKNVLTVGAGENVRSHALAAGGAGVGADGCATDDTGADSASDVISFSSRGPTADGRKKPDIVAPGTHVTGITFVAVGQNPTSPVNGLGTSDAAFRADGVCGMPGGGTAGSANNFFPLSPAQKWYTTSSGTSHSAPAVAGGAALIYQQFLNNPSYIGAQRTPAGSAAPSPALVKAYLTNSARYLTGIGANDSLPSNNQGMGSVNLGTAFDGVQRIIRDQDATDRFTASGQVRTYFATVASAAAPFRVTLAYTDKEGPTSGNAFVNDLDLTILVGGSTYKGNVFSGANSATGGTSDTRNNLESVFLPAGLAAGTTVTIQVKAANIAGQADPAVAGLNQDFALVVYNANPGTPQASLSLSSTTLTGGNGNGRLDANECNALNITLQNLGTLGASVISAVLTTTTPQVSVVQGNSTYPNIAAGSGQINSVPFQISTTAAAANGTTADFTLTVTYTGGTSPSVMNFSLPLGNDTTRYAFTATPTAATIPMGGILVPGSAADDAVVTVTTPFAFSAYGVAITAGQTISLNTNGTIQMVATGGTKPYSNTALPATSTAAVSAVPNSVVFFPYWDDLLLTTAGGGIYTNTVGAAPNRQFIIEWRGQPYSTTVGAQSVNFAVVFNEGSNVFEFRYLQTGAAAASLNGLTATVGVQAGNTAASNFTQYSFNQGVITPGLILSAGFPVATPGTGACAANVPPTLVYSPTAGSYVAFTGVTTAGSVGSGTVAVTPSAGYGTGTGATSTVNGCALTGANAANFAGVGAVSLNFAGSSTTVQNITLSCTSGSTMRNATVTCDETLGTGAATPRSWSLSCPVGTAAPQFAYLPLPGATVVATGGTTPGSTGTLSITPSVATAGSGSGAAAATTLTCTAPTAPFTGFAQSVVAIGAGAPSGGPLSGNCTLGATVQTQTISCNENRGGTNIPLIWTLSCPAGCSLDVNGDGSVTADKDAVLLSRYLLGFRGASLIANVPLGAGRPNAQAVETFIGNAAQFDVFGRAVPVASAMQDGIVLFRLMLGVSDAALFGGITVPAPATYSTPTAVRSNVNARCGTSF